MLRATTVVITAMLLALLADAVLGDTLVMSDGRRLEGRLLSRDTVSVRFEIHRAGKISTIAFDANDVDKVIPGPLEDAPAKPAATAQPLRTIPLAPGPRLPGPNAPPLLTYNTPTYYIIPLKGQVGVTMTADVLSRSMSDAAARKPTVVILEIDSPGGAVDEVTKMVEVLSTYKGKLRTVVLVHRAISAAAITALACDQIYMRHTAVIGAATAFKFNQVTGIPENIEEKFESIWRATARSSAEVGGHPTVLAEAMIDRKVPLYKSTHDGKSVISSTPGDGAVALKPAGKLLAMTAQEAIDCTLAAGIADDEAELGKAIGYEGWVECVGLGVPLAKYFQDRFEEAQRKVKQIGEAYQTELKNARANDPSTFQDYLIFRETGKMTPESLDKWEERSSKCAAALSRAEQQLDRAAAAAKEFPAALGDPEQIARLRTALDEVRAHIVAQSRR
jgi:ATP-dependent protease ClpP protease subunit